MTSIRRSKLLKGAESALKVVHAGRQIARIQDLWSGGEHSFALLIVWIRIEALLKLVRYYDMTDEDWPSDLSFVTTKWKRLKRLEDADAAMYAQVFRGEGSLRQLRNQIAHGGLRVDPVVGAPLGYAGEWVASSLEAIAPRREALNIQMRRRPER